MAMNTGDNASLPLVGISDGQIATLNENAPPCATVSRLKHLDADAGKRARAAFKKLNTAGKVSVNYELAYNATAHAEVSTLFKHTTSLLPCILLPAGGLADLSAEIDAARKPGIFAMTVQRDGAIKRGEIGKGARKKMRARSSEFPLLVAIIDRVRAVRAQSTNQPLPASCANPLTGVPRLQAIRAAPTLMVPWIQEEPVMLLREIAGEEHSNSGGAAYHGDWEHSTEDTRLRLSIAEFEALMVSSGDRTLKFLPRQVMQLGAAAATSFVSIKAGVEVVIEGEVDGSSNLIDVWSRAVTPGVLQPWVHAGLGAGKPRRLQFVPDWTVFSPAVWNRVMAKFLLHDVLQHPGLDLRNQARTWRLGFRRHLDVGRARAALLHPERLSANVMANV